MSRPSSRPVVYTVGHSTRAIEEFLALLDAHRIATLVDVRRFPASRRHPHFNRESLAAACEAGGITYVHESALGGRRATGAGGRAASPNTAWRVGAFRAYADYAATEPFRRAFDRVLAFAARQPTAVMCAEAVWWRCHRRLIADYAVARGWTVLHILAVARADPHDLHPDARVRSDGTLVYPAPEGAQAELWE